MRAAVIVVLFIAAIIGGIVLAVRHGEAQRQLRAADFMSRCASAQFTAAQCDILKEMRQKTEEASDDADDASSLAAVSMARGH